MRQAYDPYAGVGMTERSINKIGEGVGNIVGSVAQWKEFRTNQKSDDEAKQKFFSYTLSALQEKGIDPKSVPELELLGSRMRDRRIGAEAFAEMTAKALEPIKEKLLFQEAAKEYGAGGQPQQTDQMAGQQPTPTPQQLPPQGGVVDTMYGGVSNPDLAAALTGGTPADTMAAPQQAVPQTQAPEESPTKKYQKRMVDYYSNLADNGMLKAGDATKFYDIMAKLEHDENQSTLAEKKAKIRAEEDERKTQREKAGTGIVNARISNLRIVSRENGKEVDVSPDEALKHPELYAISKEHEQWRPPSGDSGIPGVPKNPDEIKLQKAVIDRLRQMNAGDFVLVNKEDAMGNIIPTYVPKPNSKSAQILSNSEWYNEFVTKYLPNYARAVGIKPPTQGTKGSGF